MRDKESTRGRKELVPTYALASVIPDPPSWLNPEEKKLFKSLVEDAVAANGSVLKVDAIVFGNIARLQLALQNERHAKTQAQIMRTLLPWVQAAGMTAVGRARLGVKQEQKKQSPTSRLLEMVRRPS